MTTSRSIPPDMLARLLAQQEEAAKARQATSRSIPPDMLAKLQGVRPVTHKIRLGPIKSEDWGTLSAYLGFDDAVEEAHFEYGEYATIEIELDSDLRIVGGRVIPLAELRRR